MLEATKCLQPCVGGVLSSFSRAAFLLDRCQIVSVAGLRKRTSRKGVGGFLFVCLGGFARAPPAKEEITSLHIAVSAVVSPSLLLIPDGFSLWYKNSRMNDKDIGKLHSLFFMPSLLGPSK